MQPRLLRRAVRRTGTMPARRTETMPARKDQRCRTSNINLSRQEGLVLRCTRSSTQSSRTRVAPMCARAPSTATAPPSATARQARALAGACSSKDPELHHLNESRRFARHTKTNNRAELMAMIRAIQLCPDDGRQLAIQTDSQYSKDCVEKWLPIGRKGAGRHPLARMCRTGISSNSLLTTGL